MNYYQKSKKEVLKVLGSSETGLRNVDAELRLKEHGLNEIKETKGIHPLTIFFRQFKSIIVVILLVAILLSLIIGEKIDAAVIAMIVILNAILGFIQEYKAEKSIQALKKLETSKARVIRDNKEIEIESKYLIPGDIIILQEGDRVPADARLITTANLEAQESSLTGESTPVSKNISAISKKSPIADQKKYGFLWNNNYKGKCKSHCCKNSHVNRDRKNSFINSRNRRRTNPIAK